MPSTTRYKRGDIVLVPFPFTDLSSSKRRPALIVSPDWFNSSNQDLVLVAITSQIGDDPRSVLLDEADFVGGRLPKRSMVKLAKVFTIHSALIGNLFRSIQFPKTINPDKVKAEFKNGVLHVSAAIAAEAQSKRIELKAS